MIISRNAICALRCRKTMGGFNRDSPSHFQMRSSLVRRFHHFSTYFTSSFSQQITIVIRESEAAQLESLWWTTLCNPTAKLSVNCRKGWALILLRKDEGFLALSVTIDILLFLATPFPFGNFPHFHLWWHTQGVQGQSRSVLHPSSNSRGDMRGNESVISALPHPVQDIRREVTTFSLLTTALWCQEGWWEDAAAAEKQTRNTSLPFAALPTLTLWLTALPKDQIIQHW